MAQALRERGIGWLIGVSLSVAGCGAYLLGGFERIDQFGLDLHFRLFSPMQADPRIVLVDIDDSALRAAPEWPWPRRLHAGVVRTLKELGAEAIVLDLVFDRPSSERSTLAPSVSPGEWIRSVDAETGLGRRSDADDDAELRDAIADAGNVYLAMYAEPSSDDASEDSPQPVDQAVQTLLEDYSCDPRRPGSAASLLPTKGSPQASSILAQAKQIAASRLAEQFLLENPDGDWAAFRTAALPAASAEEWSADIKTLSDAFQSERAIRTVLERGLGPMRAPRVTNPVPPLDPFARAARGTGIVSFERSRGGGVLRAVSPFVSLRDVGLPQLGVLVAADFMRMQRSAAGTGTATAGQEPVHGDRDTMRPRPSSFADEASARLQVGADLPRTTLPRDANGEMLIAWIRPPMSNDWRSVFQHLSASPLLEIVFNRNAVGENQRRWASARAELVRIRHAETPAEYADYLAGVDRGAEIESRLRSPLEAEARRGLEEELRGLVRSTHAAEEDALVWLRRAWELWSTATPNSPQEASERAAIRRLHDEFVDGAMERRFSQANARLTARTEALLADLRSRIHGRICLVGYTASAQGDLVSTPTFTSMPGVMAHAHVINMLVQNRVPRRAGAEWNGPLLLAAGVVVTLIARRMGALGSLGGSGLLVVAILAAGAWIFYARLVHIAAVVGSVQCAVVWAGVTAYRQLTEERARRKFQRALGQYTSPAIAAHVAGRVRSTDFLPRPARVTVFFSDLRGFTRLSERLGPARTRERLNPYLGAVSEALVEQRAIVNKFIGDGIMAFFNAPILPCADHARAACAAALAARDAVNRLSKPSPTDADEERLYVRIGLATGDVFVGDYGTDMKLDYTCIGDTVNVASRLERANKSTGTQILVDAATRTAAGGEFAFRAIGRLQVVGRVQSVECYELLGWERDVDDSQRCYAERFGEVVARFQACDWPASTLAVQACRRLRPDDPLLAVYARLAAAAEHQPGLSSPLGERPLHPSAIRIADFAAD